MRILHPDRAALMEATWHGDRALTPPGVEITDDRPLTHIATPFWVPSGMAALIAIPIALVAMQVAVLMGWVGLLGGLLMAAGLWAGAALLVGLPRRWRAHRLRRAADRVLGALSLDRASHRVVGAILARQQPQRDALFCNLIWKATPEGMRCVEAYVTGPMVPHGGVSLASAHRSHTQTILQRDKNHIRLEALDPTPTFLPWPAAVAREGYLLSLYRVERRLGYHIDLRQATAHQRMGVLHTLAG